MVCYNEVVMSNYTREDIEALAKKPYCDLTAEERRLVNLSPWKSGQSGNPTGMKKGTKQWATRIRKLMDDEKFLKTIISNLPKDWDDIVGETPAEVVAAALIGNLVRVCAKEINSDKPMSKDIREMVALLNKIGYGDKIIHEVEDSFFQKGEIYFNVVPDRKDIDKPKE